MTRALSQIALLTGKDLRIETRTRQTIGLIVVLAILIVVVLGVGLARPDRSGFAATAILWVAYLFGGVLCFEKTMDVERNDDALAGLLLAPVDRGVIFASKLLSNLVLIFGLAIVVTPVAVLLFGFDLSGGFGAFVAIIAVAIIGFAAIGTLFSAAVSSTKLQGGFLAMIIFPLSLPIVLYSTQLLLKVFQDGGELNVQALAGLGAIDVLFLIGSWLVFELILEP